MSCTVFLNPHKNNSDHTNKRGRSYFLRLWMRLAKQGSQP